ncbi:hypothetical protein LOY52_19780 [Pseudomonas sp. B21-051]|uniref:hypothetical protein n=1 Tax=Pseudomonas sp. B21-051 TaxID=2895491 RepID=UPI0021608110|nr:hypothetical protein [Pseudomonas sp. B21-051]UVK87088.1 hypothetical protein LOY52_19780 [Pseudomonas sp. B21-051]
MTGFSYLSFSKRRAKQNNPRKPGLCEESAKRQCQKSGNRFPLAAAFLPLASPVGAAEGCDLLILFFKIKIKIKRSQPSAAPT